MIYKIFLLIVLQQALRGVYYNSTEDSDHIVDSTMFLEDE